MSARQYRAWRPAYRRWLTAVAGLGARLAECEPAMDASCLALARERLRAQNARLAARLARLGSIPGGCGALAATAREGLRLLGEPADELRLLLAARDPPAWVAWFDVVCRPRRGSAR